jgi:ribosomal protein S18 acetylase RimI-like enzyme
MAEDSQAQLDSYLDAGQVLVALAGDRVVGHLQLVDTQDAEHSEIKNMAVEPSYRGRGVGRILIDAAVGLLRAQPRSTLVVATAAADIDNLRFYQRTGFRLRAVERDAFTPARGYRPHSRLDGIDLRDRVWLDRSVRDR